MHIHPKTLQFLANLKENNTKEWFNEHKGVYTEAKENFEEFVDALIKEIATFDPAIGHHTAKSTVFRIYRDVRFSKDKSPYKTNFGAHITEAKKKSDIHHKSGYYFHLEPGGNTMLAGGAYMPTGDWLKNIRQEIDYNAPKFLEVVESEAFKSYFGALQGETLKRPPKGYDETHAQIHYLKHKSFLAMHYAKDELVTMDSFLNHAKKVYQALKPLGDFLNAAQVE